MAEQGFNLERIRQTVYDRHDMPTSIYIGHLEGALRACKERLRYIRNRRTDLAKRIVGLLLPAVDETGKIVVTAVEELLSKELSEIFVVEGGIQGMIDKLKELVPDPKSQDKDDQT